MTFPEFYRTRRDRDPFPWMCRLAECFAEQKLPDIIDLPTGSGKSDIVFAWAWARRQTPQLPRRLWMVSDRRVIVDQTYEVAQLIGDGTRVSRLHGGIVTDDDDVLDPVAEQVITSTVDQLGSRLLFRAYGASSKAWPIWAGLAGNDSLVVLDEAHLSPVAEDTFRACMRLNADITIISMTATPRLGGSIRFALDQSDQDHPVLGRRLRTRRTVELRDTGSLVEAAGELLQSGCRRIAVICNTVRSARTTFGLIKHKAKHLLIGRQRPIDRDRILAGLVPRLRSGAEATEPLVVVTTQCIEAGADFDFDAMVSEACPIDALRQRLGRLDRLGTVGDGRCIMIKPVDFKDVPPYGKAPEATWRWLQKHAKKKLIDLGAEGWAAIGEFVPEEARSSRPEAITILEPHVRMLARTSPRPRIEPDIDLLLHGRNRSPGAVSLVWRRDVAPKDPDAATEVLGLLPPDSLEACEVPLWEVRAWLLGKFLMTDAGDVEGGAIEEPEPDAQPTVREVLRWDGADASVVVVKPDALRAGDVLIVPAQYGGYDAFGWNPAHTKPVTDLAGEARLQRTGRIVERFDDPDATVTGDRVRRWSGGVVVETFTDEPRSKQIPIEVSLDDHRTAVAATARDMALCLELDAEALFQAGLCHDDGKADPRWQLLVNGGQLNRLAAPPLAKGPYFRSALSRLPAGWRHEAESLSRLPETASGLVRWLVATHHGHARPFWPIPEHGIGLSELMERLHAEHGYWRLALFEAVLRCADRAVSKKEMADAVDRT